jgi:hypothetical protein
VEVCRMVVRSNFAVEDTFRVLGSRDAASVRREERMTATVSVSVRVEKLDRELQTC